MSWYLKLLVSGLLVNSCSQGEKVGLKFDEILFEMFGETLFIKPAFVSFKEVHLGMAQGDRKVIKVDGRVIELGRHQTYIVIGNLEDRLIVATSDAYESGEQKLKVGLDIGVVGVIEAGKKGMPFLRAYAINIKGS